MATGDSKLALRSRGQIVIGGVDVSARGVSAFGLPETYGLSNSSNNASLNVPEVVQAFYDRMQEPVTCLTRLFTFEFDSAETIRLTSHDVDVVRGGNTYRAGLGYTYSALEQKADLSVNNIELEGLLEDEVISEGDVRSGKFDSARLTIEIVFWDDPDLGSLVVLSGLAGTIQITEGGSIVFEGLGVQQYLTRPVVAQYTPSQFSDIPPADILLKSPGTS